VKVAKNVYKVGIVFGRERNGLTNEEMAMGDLRTVIPANEDYDVLNLAQAVNIMAYEFWQRKLELENLININNNSNGDLLNGISEMGGELNVKGSDKEEVVVKERDRLASRGELFLYLEKLFIHLDSGDSFPAPKPSPIIDESPTHDVVSTVTEAKKPFSKKELLSLSTIFQRVLQCIG